MHSSLPPAPADKLLLAVVYRKGFMQAKPDRRDDPVGATKELP
jgi:hypothetical protein